MTRNGNDNEPMVGKMANPFPPTKIKGLLRQEESIGNIWNPAVDLIGTSSALFIEQLSSTAIQIARNEAAGQRYASDNTRSKQEQPLVITLNHLQQSVTNPTPSPDCLHDTAQQCPQKFEFLEDIMKGGYKSIPLYHKIYAKKEAAKSVT